MRRKIKPKYRKERCLLMDVLPYEVPLTFTNQQFHDFVCAHRIEISDGILSWKKGSKALSAIIHLLFGLHQDSKRIGNDRRFIGEKEHKFVTYNVGARDLKPLMALKPFGYRIDHKEVEFRELTVPHPRSQLEVVSFYERYKETILYHCRHSEFSIRKPARIARYVYHKDRTHYERLAEEAMSVEQHDHEYEHLKSFFVYRNFSNVYKFYDSHKYHRCEKKYNALLKLDISKCFDSIYTHSLSWAVYGKQTVKENLGPSENTFPGQFDRLMQRMNYNETHGIIIGPEFSRIFAEILLQSVDKALERELNRLTPPLRHRTDYEVFRYVDDYFVFYNEEPERQLIEATLKHLLKDYGLHLSSDKAKVYDKPIITEISRAKRRITSLFDEQLKYTLEDISKDGETTAEKRWRIAIDSKKLIVQFKTILRECGVTYRELLNYTLAVVDTKVERILRAYSKATAEHRSEEQLVCALVAILEFVFFIYSVSPRASPTIKLCRILRMICGFLNGPRIPGHRRHRVLKDVFDNICLVLRKNKSDKHTQVETLYLLIALTELGKEYWLEQDLLASYFNIRLSADGLAYETCHELNYFAITVALFYMRDKRRYSRLRACIEHAIAQKFKSRSTTSLKEAELTFLLFDTLTCPFVSASLKHELLKHYGINELSLRNEIIAFKAPKRTHPQWFTIWRNFNYGRELDRKKGLEVY